MNCNIVYLAPIFVLFALDLMPKRAEHIFTLHQHNALFFNNKKTRKNINHIRQTKRIDKNELLLHCYLFFFYRLFHILLLVVPHRYTTHATHIDYKKS